MRASMRAGSGADLFRNRCCGISPSAILLLQYRRGIDVGKQAANKSGRTKVQIDSCPCQGSDDQAGAKPLMLRFYHLRSASLAPPDAESFVAGLENNIPKHLNGS